jgi:ribosomal-protein-alanine N-acetyltransferase
VYRENHDPPLKIPCEIVEMTLADVNDILEIEHLSFPTPWSKTLFLKEYHSQHSKIFLARYPYLEQKKVLGYICTWFVCGEVHILNLACHPHFRRNRVATNLLEHCLSFSFQKGVKKAFLEVRACNHEAQALYAHYGFKPIGLRKGYYSDTHEDAIVMLLEMKFQPSFK